MKKFGLGIFGLAIAVSLALIGCSGKEGGIAVIPKGTTHSFWKSIHAGALKAADELGVEIIWMGPLKEDDRASQITVVETFVSRGVDGIVLAPLDEKALVRPVEEAAKRNIPTVIIDSDLQSDQHVSFVATDNYKGGTIAAEHLGTLMEGEGKILAIRYQEGSASTQQREAGFLDTMRERFPQIEILVSDQYAGATTETAYQLAESLFNRFGQEMDGLFCPNESSTFGFLQALKAQKLDRKVTFVGFDASEPLLDAMESGIIQGLVAQNPFHMGYLGVKTMVAHLRGEPVEKRVDTGVLLVTPENLNDPAIQDVIRPDLAQWLDE
ncbi:MAG: substrate-binding domain-containing protein [Verrucomicrobiota bacterium]|jgi:ribose transport system substrate-binding protein|nr:substrate-binding domain-containing protein [Verrucomicrobiota bacterium]MDD8045018.1 substrate-binding domain-containing protein [Verrucomicrobiota bacterium]MDD8050141.1 substrate-binding domain-containing protein [Verrucomicrobiota bacterium]MDI9385008.1 substrate-binding domain-containing protein [Verrucomicrobiota bacterium]HCF93993.1 sugar ABC transporter substrate-binding protein [Verrucomicrobiota bacterium]